MLDLSSVSGHTLTLQFSVSDCNQGAHFGYVYIDANCSSSGYQINSSKKLCVASDTTVLSGPSGFSTYSWTGPITASTQSLTTGTPGNYTLTTTYASGCLAPVLYYTLTRGSFSTLSVLAASDSVCSGSADVLTASGASTYTWSSNAGSATTNTVSVSPIANTTYTVVAKNSGGCIDSTTKTISMKSCGTTAVSQFANSANQVSVYPNPATEMLYIECKLKNATLYIMDIIGNKIKQTVVENELTTIDISSLCKGVYFLNVKTANNVITKKFIVQR